MSIPVDSSFTLDQTPSSLPTQILSTLTRPELQLWAQHQEEQLQQVVEESGPPVLLTPGFPPISQEQSIFLTYNLSFSTTRLVTGFSLLSGIRTWLYSHQNSKEDANSLF